jgi:uncharacterized protein (DUF1800 family)
MASLAPLAGDLGHRRAAHLLRRTSYRFTKAKVDQLAELTANQAVDVLFQPSNLQLNQPVYDSTATPTFDGITWINPPGQPLPDTEFNLHRRVISWWINEALHDPGVKHKMMFFFHQHMAVTANTINNMAFFDYLALLRWGALGNFKKLATKIVADNTMLRYLNNNLNTKTNPNENFAREFFELFTIGKGPQIADGDYTNYTEDDIVQAARVLTGFITRTQRDMTDPETGIPRGNVSLSRHDTGNKTFSSKFQNRTITGATTAAGIWTELNAFVDMVFDQPETARNLVRRLYRYFVHRNITPEIETDIIQPLAQQMIDENYEIAMVLRTLFKSQHFYDADDSDNANEIIGGMIKSPLELSLQALSLFNIAIPSPTTTQNYTHYVTFYSAAVIDRMLTMANMPIFLPLDVAGYSAYHQEPEYSRHWFNSTSVIPRYKLPQMLLTGKRVIGGSPNSNIGIKLNIAPWVRDSGFFSNPSDAYALVQELVEYMLPEQPSAARFDYFYNIVFLDQLPADDWTYEWQNYLNTGNETEVKIALERLIYALMFSPEYQTF